MGQLRECYVVLWLQKKKVVGFESASAEESVMKRGCLQRKWEESEWKDCMLI